MREREREIPLSNNHRKYQIYDIKLFDIIYFTLKGKPLSRKAYGPH